MLKIFAAILTLLGLAGCGSLSDYKAGLSAQQSQYSNYNLLLIHQTNANTAAVTSCFEKAGHDSSACAVLAAGLLTSGAALNTFAGRPDQTKIAPSATEAVMRLGDKALTIGGTAVIADKAFSTLSDAVNKPTELIPTQIVKPEVVHPTVIQVPMGSAAVTP